MKIVKKLVFENEKELQHWEKENGNIYAVSTKQGVLLGDITEESLLTLQKEGVILSVDNPLDKARELLLDMLLKNMDGSCDSNYIAIDKNAVKEHLISIQIEGQSKAVDSTLKIFHYNFFVTGVINVDAKGVIIANDVDEAYEVVKKQGKYEVPKENIHFAGNLSDVNTPVLFDF